MKLSVDDVISVVKETLKAEKVAESVVNDAVEKIKKLAQEIKTEEKGERVERPRKEFVSVIFETTDPTIFSGHIFQLDDGVAPHLIVDKIKEASNNYANSKKGAKNPPHSIRDAIELPANKYFKAIGVNRKSRDTFYVIKSDNKLT